MLVSLGFLFVIVAMSAFLAVLADNVGRKLGKKRLSLKWRKVSIRPKYMAMMGTALTGAGVSLLTILVVAAVSKDVRDWIVRGQAAIAQSRQLVDRNRSLEDQMRERETQIRLRDADIKRKTTQIQRSSSDLKQKEREVAEQKAELGRLTAQVNRLGKSEIPRLERELAASVGKVKETNNRLAQAKNRLDASRKRLKKVDSDLAQAQASFESAATQYNDQVRQNTDLIREQANLSKQISMQEEEIARMEGAQREAATRLASVQSELTSRQEDLAKTQSELQATEKRLEEANLLGTMYRDISYNPRVAPLMFQIQEEVTRLPVPSGMTQDEAEAAVSKLLRMARLAAADRGAKPNEMYPEAGIFERRDPKTQEIISGLELQRQIVRQITDSRDPLLMVACSSLNAFKGERVSLDVILYPNPVVYKQGQVVAEARVDGRRDELEVYRQVSELVGSRVKERAQRDRMIPRSGNGEAFGTVTGETMLRLVGDVRATERTVRLIAMASTETRAGDPLKLSFQIR